MKNELVFKRLNNETKEYLSVVYSIMDYLNNCNPSIPVTNSDGETIYVAITDGNYINGLAFFLAGLYVDGPTKEFFNSRDITFENCFNYINSDNNTEFKLIGDDLFNNEAFGLINLGSYLGTISTQIKDDYYLADKDFSINDIEGYQIFDYSMIFYTDIVEDLMYEMFGIDDFFKSELFDDYQTTREGIYANMAKERYDVDIFKTRDEMIWEFDFERFKFSFFRLMIKSPRKMLILCAITVPSAAPIALSFKIPMKRKSRTIFTTQAIATKYIGVFESPSPRRIALKRLHIVMNGIPRKQITR